MVTGHPGGGESHGMNDSRLQHVAAIGLVTGAILGMAGTFAPSASLRGLAWGMDGTALIVAAALLTISLNPAAFAASKRLVGWLQRRPALLDRIERKEALPTPSPTLDSSRLRDHAIIVGFGRVGSSIGETLASRQVPYVVIEQDREAFERIRDRGIPALYGNASRAGVLHAARPGEARLILITTPDPFQARAVLEIARRANPAIHTVVRTHSDEERAYLERQNVGLAVLGERELAQTMARQALRYCGAPDEMIV